MTLLVKLFINGFAVLAAAYLVPGVTVDSLWVAIIVALVLGILNTLVRPVVVLLTLPINILTLGLFTLVINVAIIYLAAGFVPGFRVDGFLYALLFSLVLSLINGFISAFES